MPSQRAIRIGEQIQQELSDIMLRGLRDPRVGMVTIMSVDVTGDLRLARVYFTVMGDEEAIANCQQGLDSACSFLRRELGKRLRLRHIPELQFRYDTSVAYGSHIEELIRQIHDGEDAE